jgi:hypothetical protein
MQSHQCLFFHENNECNGRAKNEHVIQAALGGTLSSPDLICESCNHYFSQGIDTEIAAFYEPIIKVLAPFLPGRPRRTKRNSRLISDTMGRYDIEYVKGVVSLPKIKKFRSSDGHLQRIIAPASTDPAMLARIAAREGVKAARVETMLLTEYFRDAREDVQFRVNHGLIRGILLDVLELAAYASRKEGSPSIAAHPCLSDLRRWTRTGRPSAHFPPKNILYSFAPLADFIAPLFEGSTFSHKLIVSFDHPSKVLLLVAQFFDTMPWLFVLENTPVHTSSVSVLYKKSLLDGRDQFLWEKHAVLHTKTIRWRTFSVATRAACEFAQTKLVQEFNRQLARAYYESDLRNDAFIKERLKGYAEKSGREPEASITAIAKLVENRYEGSPHLADIVETVEKIAVERWPRGDHQEMQRLLLYRDCLTEIKSKYGYPNPLHSLR